MFEIKFDKSGSLFDSNPDFNLAGKITIGDFYESLIIPINFWSEEDYISQWKSALSEVLSSTETQSALIVQMFDPEDMECVISWPLYRSGDTIYIQNRIILPEHIGGPFILENLKEYIGQREASSEDEKFGPVSEWEVSVDAIRSALNKLNRLTKEGNLNKTNYSEHFKSGLMIVGAIILVTIVTVPFTSIWVPIVVSSFYVSVLLLLSLINIMNPKSQGNPIIRSFEQISKGCEIASDFMRF
jgi:hypothetical protein